MNKLTTRIVRNRKQLGQGMTEYVIIVALVAVAAIGVYSAFGHTLKHQVAAISNGLAGQDPTTETGDAATEAGKAVTSAGNANGMDKFGTDVQIDN